MSLPYTGLDSISVSAVSASLISCHKLWAPLHSQCQEYTTVLCSTSNRGFNKRDPVLVERNQHRFICHQIWRRITERGQRAARPLSTFRIETALSYRNLTVEQDAQRIRLTSIDVTAVSHECARANQNRPAEVPVRSPR